MAIGKKAVVMCYKIDIKYFKTPLNADNIGIFL